MAAAVGFLSYSHVRRQQILADVKTLQSKHVVIEAPNELIDMVWQRRPDRAYVWLHDPELAKQVTEFGVQEFTWTCQR